MSQAKLIGAQLGMAIFGPTGALVGGVAGAVIDATLPWGDDVLKNIVADLLATGVQRAATGLARRDETVTVNHDLQRAFRDAVGEALADIGGPDCFPKSWPDGRRDVPPQVVYLTSPLGQSSLRQRDALADQVCALLTTIAQQIEQNKSLPLQPSEDQPAANVLTYLESATSQALAEALYDITVFPVQRQFSTLLRELPDLERHLRRYLLDRTMLHLGEFLKRRTEPWRAFNRWILEDLRASLTQVKADNRDIIAGLAGLSERLERLMSGGEANPGMDGLAAATADSVSAARLAAEDMTLLVDNLIEGITHQLAKELGELRNFVAQQTTLIVTTISATEARLEGMIAVNREEMLRHFEQIETTLTVLSGRVAVAQPRGPIVASFRGEALRIHRTQSIPWRGVGGTPVTLDRVYLGQELLAWDEPDRSDSSSGEDRAMTHGSSPGAVLLNQRAIVVLGEPGSGKTLLLRALALELASTCRLDSDGTVRLGFLPIYVPLAGFTQATADLGAEPAARLLGYIQRVVDADAPDMSAVLDDLMMQGRVTFLFDALDEVRSRTEQRAVLSGIQTLATGIGSRCLFAVAVREAAYHGSLTLKEPFRAYRLAPLTATSQQAAIRRWLAVLSDLDEQDDQDIIESQTRQSIGDLSRHPGMQHALRNPLLLRITLQAYLWAGSAEGMPGLGKRFDLYISRMLAGSGESGTRQPAWPDPDQARRYLEQLAWKIYDGTGRGTQAEAEQLLRSDCGLSEIVARRFVRQIQENAGLLVLSAPNAKETRPEHTTLTFGPHALFGDFLVGSELARRWRQNRHGCSRLLRQKADDPKWQQAVLFCLSLLYADEVERKLTFGFVVDELSRVPLWGVRCLREGLELTADELAIDERRQVLQRLGAKADAVLNPNVWKGLRLRLRHRTDDDWAAALRDQYNAVWALGKLQLCEAAGSVLRSVFWLATDYKHVGEPLRSALVDFGPRCLWPGIQDALLSNEEWIRRNAAWVISSWRCPEAIPALEWLLEHEEFATAAIYGLASMTDTAVDATYRSLLADPRYADDALSAGLQSQRPGLLEHALSKLRTEQLAEHHVKFMLEYALRLSATEASAAVRELLGREPKNWEIAWVFEVDRSLQLPLLRILVGMLRDPEARLRERAQEAIPRVLKAGDLDPQFQDSQGLLEQIMLYANEWLPEMAARWLSTTTLSTHASQILWERIQNPETQPEVIRLLPSLPQLPEEYRQRFIGRLTQDAETAPYDTGYLYCALAYLGNRSVIPELDRRLKEASSFGQYDDRLLMALVRLRAVEAFPYVMARIVKGEDSYHESGVALAMLASKLSLQQRREAARSLQPLLESGAAWMRWVGICALGELRVSTPEELLSQVRDNVLEVQEPAIGLALAQVGNYEQLTPVLEAACARRDATLYFTVLHTWSALGDPRGINPLLQTLGLPDNFLRSADPLLSGGNLVTALRYVKARAALNLGRLAASLAGDLGFRPDPMRGWGRMLLKLDDRIVSEAPGVVPLLRGALAQPAPAHALYEQTLSAHGLQREILALLVGAYEWSDVLTHLSRRHDADSLQIWELIDNMFDRAEAGEQGSAQKRLAGRIGWTEEQPPFDCLMRLAAHRDETLHKQARYYFAREAREWSAWLKWRADVLVLPA